MDVAALTPLEFEKKIINRNIPPKAENTFNITSNKNNNFIVIFSNISNYIHVKSHFIKEQIKKEYEKVYFLDELKNNKYLSICDSIDEIYDQIILEAKNSTEKTIIEENNKISIIININHIKIKYIKFTLFEKIKSDRNLIQDLLDEINNLKNNTEEKFIKLEKDNKNLKDEIFLLKEENKKLYENYNLLLKDIKEIKGKNNSINQYSQYNQDLLYLSSILNSDINGTNKIKSWIKEKTNKDSLTFKLIFRMSENGYKGSDFHKYCDIEEPTLILIKSKCNNIFGGFTPLSWGKETYPIDKSN